jgi:hypothetical protein
MCHSFFASFSFCAAILAKKGAVIAGEERALRVFYIHYSVTALQTSDQSQVLPSHLQFMRR